jgi:hypothetical protein
MQTANEILERASDLGWPMVVCDGGPTATETAWRHAAEFPGNRANLAAQLDGLEAAAHREAERKIAEAADDASRTAAYDPALAEEVRAEAAADLARYEAGRPARVEALLQRIADALEKR